MQEQDTSNQQYRPRGLSPIQAVQWHGLTPDGDCRIWTRSRDHRGYGKVSHSKTMLMVHRVVFEDAHGAIPAGMELDHTCHNRACANLSHLRLVTHQQNVENHQGPKAHSKSGVRGVCWAAPNRKWKAQVQSRGKNYNLGYFTDLAEAERVVIAKRRELHTHNDADRIAK